MTRAQQLADAIELVAKANHYMVGIVGNFSFEDLETAKQILINRQNTTTHHLQTHADLALDIVEQMEKDGSWTKACNME